MSNIKRCIDRMVTVESHKTTIILTVIFNLIDAVLTLAWVTWELALESNPIMASAIDMGPIQFMTIKIVIVNLGVTVLWLRREKTWVRCAALGTLGVYSYVMMIHLFFIIDTIINLF